CIILQTILFMICWLGDATQIDLKSFGFMNVSFLIVYILLNGVRNIGSNMMIPMMADCTDYEVYRSGHYVPGLIATVYSFCDKLISSFATTIVGICITFIGFSNTVPQIGDKLTTGIFVVTMILYNGMPILGWVISIIAMKFYPLTGEKMKEIEDSIVEIKKSNVSENK
ncbi:MAG TPA: MFS transporter, partial [Candidatus Merdenecus merdavium]|nr:MFS transporter [Candidatus Merdenecus merdavium]